MGTCRLFRVNRQIYYRKIKSEKQKRKTATKVVAMVSAVRMKLPELGTRKLYNILQSELQELGVGSRPFV